MDDATREAVEYLKEVLGDYEACVERIGSLGLAAPNLLYYRDEVQEFLEILEGSQEVDMKPFWEKIRHLDNLVRAGKNEIVREVGHKNFKQYQIINDPPARHWWWHLDRISLPPPEPPRPWEFWRS